MPLCVNCEKRKTQGILTPVGFLCERCIVGEEDTPIARMYCEVCGADLTTEPHKAFCSAGIN